MRRFFLLACINVVMVVLLLGLVEGFLRWADPGRKLPPNGWVDGKQYTWGHPVHYNKLGFRERDFEFEKPQDAFRIMVLGDSLTWGVGLALEERYSHVLEQLLQRRFPKPKIEVINFSRPGLSTIMQKRFLEMHQDKVHPDLIVLGFCANDPQFRFHDYSVEREQFQSKWRFLSRRIFPFLKAIGLGQTGKLLKKSVYGIAEFIGLIPNWQTSLQRTYEETSQEWKAFMEALKDIKTLSAQQHLAPPLFAVLNYGLYDDRPTDFGNPNKDLTLHLQWWHQAEKAAASLGYKTVNFEKEITADFSQVTVGVSPVDAHPSAALHVLYAEKLADVIGQDHRFR